MATLKQLLNKKLISKARTANKGKVAPDRPSGFATRDQKRRDIRVSFGFAAG